MEVRQFNQSGAADLIHASLSFKPLLVLLAETLRRRRIRRNYGRMNDAQLCDIGLTPQDVVVALSLPLKHNAEEALAVAAAREAARW